MGFSFLVSGILSLLIVGFLIYGFLKHFKKVKINKASNWFAINIFGYFALSIFYIVWFFKILDYSPEDFLVIYGMVVFVQTILFFKISYLLNKNKAVFYLGLLYLASLLSVFISLSFTSLVILLVSFFLMLVLSFSFCAPFTSCKRAAYVNVIYAGVSLLWGFALLFDYGDPGFFSLFSNLVFLIFTYLFLKDIVKYPLHHHESNFDRKESKILLFAQYFVFIVVLTNLVLVSTLGAHEFGHVVASRYYGCEAKSIFYEAGNYPYTEIVCNNLSGKIQVTLAGPFLPILVAFFLFLIGGRFVKSISFLIVGFDLLAAFRDFTDLGLSQNILFASSILGVIFLFVGIFLLAKSRVSEYYHFN